MGYPMKRRLGRDDGHIIINIIIIIALMTGAVYVVGRSSDDWGVNALDQVGPIVIDGDAELASHPQVDSGSGTQPDPYVISDISIDCSSSGRSAISVRNTTKHLVIRNVTVRAPSSVPAINLRSYYNGANYVSMYLTLENVTVIGGSTHVYMYVPIRVTLTRCNFSNPSGSGNIIHSYYGYYSFLDNNTFNSPGMDILLDHTSYSYITRNRGSIRDFTQNYFRSSDVANNTFELRTMNLYSGYFSYFQGNNLTGRSSGSDVVHLYDCNRVMIANNSIYGGRDGIFVQHPNSYNPPLDNYQSWSSLTFEYNLINGTAGRGIYFYWWTGHPYIAYMRVHHNRFLGCGGHAVEVTAGGSSTSHVYLNIFRFNHGSSSTYSALTAQARDAWSQFRWSDNSRGSYWEDWDNTDDDSDGFSDTRNYQLTSNNGGTDPFPLSNPYYDFSPPGLEILTPQDRFLDNRYVNITWRAWDNTSGLKMVQVRKGISPWMNITDRDHQGFYLNQGQYNIDIRAVDMAGLTKAISLNLVIETPGEPVVVTSPLPDGYYSTSEVDVAWEMIDGFVPLSLSTSLDGGSWIEKDPFSGHMLTLDEGAHTYLLNFTDHYGIRILRTVSFTVDASEPELSILYPVDGSVISNGLVNFMWSVEDLSGIRRTSVSIDGGALMELAGSSHSEFLEKGPHTFLVEVEDMAGNTASSSISFSISVNTSLHITSPVRGLISRSMDHELKWEYLTSLDISILKLFIDDMSAINLPPDATSYDFRLSGEGEHDIMLRAEDPAGNVFSDSTYVIIDRTAPKPDFLRPNDGEILNATEIVISWGSLEEVGLAGYDLIVDGSEIAVGTEQTSTSVILAEGEHTFVLRARDLAGNMDETSISIVVDITLPDLNLLSPESSVITEPYITMRWEGYDLNGIAFFNYTLDGKKTVELGSATSREIQMSEGPHVLVLRCTDNAGNVRTVRKEFIVDLTPPTVRFTTSIGEYVSIWNGLVSWEVIESVGISRMNITIDGTTTSLATDSTYHIFDAEEGPHSITIAVWDLGGWSGSDSLSFILDMTPPRVAEGGSPEVEGDSASIFWTLEEGERIDSVKLEMDGKEMPFSTDPYSGAMTFTELERGHHVVNLTFSDQAGNEKTLEFEFDISGSSSKNQGGGGSSGWIFILIVLILVVVAALAAFLVLRKGKDKGNEKREGDLKGRLPVKPDKISIGAVPAAPAAGAPRHTRVRTEAPPGVRAPGRSSTHVREGYIRPERKAGKAPKRMIRDIRGIEGSVKKGDRFGSSGSESVKEGEDIEDWSEVDEFEELEEMDEYEEMEEI